MQQPQKQQQEAKKFQFCDVQEEEGQQEQEQQPTLHTAITQKMQETVHIPGAWADLLLDDSWTTVQRKKRRGK
jgi:hypothetical protein